MMFNLFTLQTDCIDSRRPHCIFTVHRCGLLLQMSRVAWSVCLCVFAVQKRLKLSRCRSGSRVMCCQNRTIPLAAATDDKYKSAMRTFARLLRAFLSCENSIRCGCWRRAVILSDTEDICVESKRTSLLNHIVCLSCHIHTRAPPGR